MYKTRKQKLFMIIALVAGIVSLSIGFAAFSTTLNISSSASVNPNSDSFKVKFSTNKDSLVVGTVTPSSKSSGLTASNGSINNTTNPTLTNLNATFTSPGQYVEYTVYARNEGEYTAYLNSVNFIGDNVCRKIDDISDSLLSDACDGVVITVSIDETVYNETTAISNHTLNKSEGEEIKVRLEYLSSSVLTDGSFSIEFPDITLVYSTINDSDFYPLDFDFGENDNKLYSVVRSLATKSDYGLDFKTSSVNGVYANYDSEGDLYPVYYYRGSVDDNHVLFANKCWLIVRTTETGGVKLLYNGVPTNGVCGTSASNIGDYNVYNSSTGSDNAVRFLKNDGTDSDIKAVVDAWYANNLVDYTDFLEDTPWCQDLNVLDLDSEFDVIPETFVDYKTYYSASKRLFLGEPNLYCAPEYQLKVESSYVSNKLKYPIGLLTVDEAILGGLGDASYSYYDNNSYLINWGAWVTMTPAFYNSQTGKYHVYNFYLDGQINPGEANSNYEVRPAISLKHDTIVNGGNGKSTSPYLIN